VRTVLLALSGGVDSSVAATLLQKAGYRLIALTMRVYDGITVFPHLESAGCFSPNEKRNLQRASDLAKRLGIEHHIVDLSREYRQYVLDYFRKTYLVGQTPNPCIQCNRFLKFGFLRDYAKKMGISFDYFATGHYARIVYSEQTGRYSILRAVDKLKDQSYFISHLSQKQLQNVIFPLGTYTKADVKTLAIEQGWVELSQQKESQDFIKSDNYPVLFENEKIQPGSFVDKDGNVLGVHSGIINYTIGQRRGIKIAAPTPLYVTEIDPVKNNILIGKKEDLFHNHLLVKEINWVSIPFVDAELKCLVQIRQRHKASSATVIPRVGGTVEVFFDQPQMAITPGQVAAFYDLENGDVLLGAGTIDSL